MNPIDRNSVKKELQKIPNVGPRLASILLELGYHEAADLVGENPETMYARVCGLHGKTVDRCVLYVFRFAVEWASTPEKIANKKWWDFKD